jgi:hypothetical protein
MSRHTFAGLARLRLGLAISSRLGELMGGRIWVETQELGKAAALRWAGSMPAPLRRGAAIKARSAGLALFQTCGFPSDQ